jgi:hypothetical protein
MRYLTLTATAILAGWVFAPAARAADQEWGTIKGQVVWAGGAIPQRAPVKGNLAGCNNKGPILAEDWVVNPKNQGVQWVLVWLDVEPKSGQKLPIHPALQQPKQKKVTMDQPCCMFEPHVLGLREGQQLEVKNSAGIAHNVNWNGNPMTNPGGNQVIPPGGALTIDDLKADRYPLSIACNIHPWMNARVGVFSHPYFAVTDADGNFEIKDAPAGNYRLKVWQESMGWLGGKDGRDGQKITIKPNAVTNVGKLGAKPN